MAKLNFQPDEAVLKAMIASEEKRQTPRTDDERLAILYDVFDRSVGLLQMKCFSGDPTGTGAWADLAIRAQTLIKNQKEFSAAIASNNCGKINITFEEIDAPSLEA